MQEYKQYAHRTDIPHTEQIKPEETSPQRTVIGILVAQHLTRNIPANEKTSEKAAHRQEYLPRNKVENVKQRLAEKPKSVETPERKRAESPYHRARDSDNEGCTAAGDATLFMKKRRAHLVKRDERSQCGKRQQAVEQQRYDVAHNGHARERLLKDIGQGDEDERRTAVRAAPTENAAGNIISPASIATRQSITPICTAEAARLVCLLK